MAIQNSPSGPTQAPSPAADRQGRQSARLEDRYATALYELALQTGAVDSVAGELGDLQAVVVATPLLARTLRNPVLSRAGQAEALATIAARLGAGKLVQNFLRLLAQEGRQARLLQVIDAYRAIAAAARGELTASVRTAAPLTDAQQQELARELGAKHAATVTLDITVDPTLLGGFSAKVGTKLYDRTLAGQLNRLMLTLKEAA